ncbi:hypothetical protein DXG01_004833, partial [Tephrocybe rancida]
MVHIQKVMCVIDAQFPGFAKKDYVEDIDTEPLNPSDKCIFAISTAFHRGYSVDRIWEMTNINKWFLTKLEYIFQREKHLMACNVWAIPVTLLRRAKQLGFRKWHRSLCQADRHLQQ